jgi:hypothetical protein
MTMSSFNGLLKAEFQPPKNFSLLHSLTYDCDSLTEENVKDLKEIGLHINRSCRIVVPTGFITDLASVPRLCWAFLAPMDIARAAVIHDFLYFRIRAYRKLIAELELEEDKQLVRRCKKIADKVFEDAMEHSEPPVPKYKIHSAYYAVVLFGSSSIVPRQEDYIES